MDFQKVKKMAKWFKVDVDLLPIKLHYFFFFGGMGGVVPFMQVFAKGLGINATAVGIIFSVIPFFIFFSKPVFGYLTDFFRNIKVIVFILVIITTASYVGVLFIPFIENHSDSSVAVQLECGEHLRFYPLQYDRVCLETSLKQEVHCELLYRECDSNTSLALTGTLRGLKGFEPLDTNKSGCISNDGLSRLYSVFNSSHNFTCGCIEGNFSFIQRTNPSLKTCLCETEPVHSSVYSSFQFWVFTLLAVFAGTGSATVFCLSDAACYEVLDDKPELYGRQRLWATISWGIVTSSAGFLNDLSTGNSIHKDYSPGFYLMLVLVFVDVLLLLKIKMTKANFSINICEDIGKIFSSCETVVFALAVYIIGALTGLIWSYEFWYLQDLGATQTLLGLAVAVQCLAAEVPLFFFSGWLIKSFGFFYCLTGSFAAFALRFGLYYILENPWHVLPIEVIHGLTFALFYACMTGYASTNAPPGTEATMMGILGGLYEGLGVATGSLLGGVGFDKIGGRYTFLIAAIISLICVPCFLIFHLVFRKIKSKEEATSMRADAKRKYDGKVEQNNM